MNPWQIQVNLQKKRGGSQSWEDISEHDAEGKLKFNLAHLRNSMKIYFITPESDDAANFEIDEESKKAANRADVLEAARENNNG